jgi:malic enzyme
MAIYATEAKRMTDDMFIEARKAVADQVTCTIPTCKSGSSPDAEICQG